MTIGNHLALLMAAPIALAVPVRAAEPLAPLVEYRSQNGILDVAIDARPTRIRLGNREIDAATYNGVYAGPV
jgi:hypothetical protein